MSQINGPTVQQLDVDKSGNGTGSSGKPCPRQSNSTVVKTFRKLLARDCVSFTVVWP